MSKKLCIYHGNCADGFGAAWVVRLAYGADNVEFHPGVYQDPPPNVEGREVIIVDFSYKRPIMERICEDAATVLVLDHHKSAMEDLAGLEEWAVLAGMPGQVDVYFDMTRSGAMMAWNHFFEGPAPKLIQHIQDRDLWKFDLPGTREIQAAVFSYPYDFDVWDKLMNSFNDAWETPLFNEGAAIERKHFKDIHEFIKAAAYRMEIAGHDVPVLNAPYFWSSDAGHIMGKGEPFAACYWDTPDGRVFSLRSDENGLDVSEIAKQFGGGGHKHAAGYRVK